MTTRPSPACHLAPVRMGNIPMAAIIASKTKPPAAPLVTQGILWHCIVQLNNWANTVLTLTSG
jgi:hypothetical protein